MALREAGPGLRDRADERPGVGPGSRVEDRDRDLGHGSTRTGRTVSTTPSAVASTR